MHYSGPTMVSLIVVTLISLDLFINLLPGMFGERDQHLTNKHIYFCKRIFIKGIICDRLFI